MPWTGLWVLLHIRDAPLRCTATDCLVCKSVTVFSNRQKCCKACHSMSVYTDAAHSLYTQGITVPHLLGGHSQRRRPPQYGENACRCYYIKAFTPSLQRLPCWYHGHNFLTNGVALLVGDYCIQTGYTADTTHPVWSHTTACDKRNVLD